jgi:hypothetical protein
VIRRDSSDDLIAKGKSTVDVVELVEPAGEPWFFDSIPYSFKLWLKNQIKDMADEKWGLNDEYLVDATYDVLKNFAFFFSSFSSSSFFPLIAFLTLLSFVA